MTADPLPTKVRSAIQLSEVNDFEIGLIHIHPSLREVIVGDDVRTIEPRVMQVFVAIAQADGRVVSRDELMFRCWGGRAVGEDAMNRCIAKVRQVLKPCAATGLYLETVPRVGYRLVSTGKPGKFANANANANAKTGASPYVVAFFVIAASLLTLAVEWSLAHWK